MSIKIKLMRMAMAASLAVSMIVPAKASAATLGDLLFWGVVPALTGLTPRVWNDSPIVAFGTYTPGIEVIYLNVPNDHRHHWKTYCHRYDACHRPVYFLQGNWYRQVYVPRFHQAPPKPHARWLAPHARHPSVHVRPAPHRAAPPRYAPPRKPHQAPQKQRHQQKRPPRR